MAEKDRSGFFSPKHQKLIEDSRRGDQKAQFEIYGLYYLAMYNTALRIVGDPDDAEDVMQEAFLKAFLKLKTYKGEVSFGAWLKRIVINKSLDFLRLKREWVSLEEVGEIELTDGEETNVLETEYRVEIIKKGIFSLPEGYRIVLSLILLEGYDHDEVSEILGISNSTSRTQYHRAKKKLVELLKKFKKIMVELEKHIKQQRLLLDSDTPREGHEKRFMQKLERQPVSRIKVRYILQVAASVAIILASAFVIINQNKSGGKVAKSELHNSIMEADMYYTAQVNARYDQIKDFSFDNTEEKTVLLNELKELDTYQQQLISDLKANPQDDRVINALVRHYQIKLEVMDQIIYQLNQYKTETSKNHENESI